jgi:hypothetical protein
MSLKSRVALYVLLGAASALGATGCYREAKSEVAQGRSYRSGNAEYDRFFQATHAQQVKIGGARAEYDDARQNLTSSLVIAKDTSSDALADRIKFELDRLARQGSSVRVELVSPPTLDPSATRAVLTPASKPRSVDATLVRQVESSVTRLLRLDISMKLARQELYELAKTAYRLEASLDQAFPRGSAQRDEVIVNLRDAERAITLMFGTADETQKPTAEFLGKFAVAVGSPWRAPGAPDLAGEQRVARAGKASEPAQPPATSASSSASSAEPATRAEFEP